MVVNDNAGELDERGALESIASRLAPTGSRDWVKAPVCLQGLATCAGTTAMCGSFQLNR